ncbi:hypothetical protein [Streptomyces virginiae]
MTAHSVRPAVALTWILGLTLLLTRPEIAAALTATANWILTSPVGTAVLALAFVTALARSLWRRA